MNNNDIETTDVRVEPAPEEETAVLSEESGGVLTKLDSPASEAPTITVPATKDEDKDERSWAVPIAVGIFFVVAIAVVAILLLTNTTGDTGGASRRTGGRGGVEQADWKVSSYSLGGKHPSGKHADPPKGQSKSLEELVRRWHDSVYLFPADLKADTDKYFTDDAARAMRASGLGLPDSASKVETKKRTARIGIESDGAKRAAAIVNVVAVGDSAKGDFRVGSETHLWLERNGSKWRVIAFDLNQNPLPLEPKSDGPKGKGDKGAAEGKGGNGSKTDGKGSKKGGGK